MFLVTTPSGTSFEYLHTLVAGELYNNSFATISPDTQWMVAGEWGTMSHLQIYPTPLLNHKTSSDGGSLRLAGYIKLDHRVNDIQGCDFVTPVRLICASDDDSRTLFPNEKPLSGGQSAQGAPRRQRERARRRSGIDPAGEQLFGHFRSRGRRFRPVDRRPAGGSHPAGLLHSQHDGLRVHTGRRDAADGGQSTTCSASSWRQSLGVRSGIPKGGRLRPGAGVPVGTAPGLSRADRYAEPVGRAGLHRDAPPGGGRRGARRPRGDRRTMARSRSAL